MRYAITREVPGTINDCQLVELDRSVIDIEKARRQHQAYCDLLTSVGWKVVTLPREDRWPDSVFVEDTAIVVDECAILARPGAESRRAEVAPIAEVLRRYRSLEQIDPAGTLDGGDVLVQGQKVWIGRTSRTNNHAIDQVKAILQPFGYTVQSVAVAGCLHLKSAATPVGERHVVVNTQWVDVSAFEGCEVIETPADEPGGANVLDLGDCVVVDARYPGLQQKISERGFQSEALEASELAKAEGALTCCSLLIQDV